MSKKIGIMQPYFLPYVGYFQLLNSVDEFVIYDNIKYTKSGWINRNRMLFGGSPRLFTVNLKKDSDFLNVVDRNLSESWKKERNKILGLLRISYQKSPNFEETYEIIKKCFLYENENLFEFILNSINVIKLHLCINTPIVISSAIKIDHSLKSQDKVIEICKERGGDHYINPIGGTYLYDKGIFKSNGIKLNFIKSHQITYDQLDHPFVPSLSIIDVMMFNSKEKIQGYLKNYDLI